MNGKTLEFNGDIKDFKTKDGTVTISLTASAENISLDELNEIAQGVGLKVNLEARQQELINDSEDEEADGQTKLEIVSDEDDSDEQD
ncbi:hypothetical protein [Lactobacillus sp. ESL0677]|uniref:hypothetical protein n=1 Tax=Lactobacillus sp. ESL0677 TaxID=2983208 RepID=UPI0023F835E8|nr:hypothetical protein [Lactobacillus sp. ESL0677]WEV37709.1 hypothetical protein OZX76_03920 [Lactobacillus sp. ESL0677]